ncbi:hypothetical protein FITA111629_05405 [Filibacter tadaridae]|uniref:Group-specific protein n=1 Tax=Filibacter tadaridae TaxID=2483811 RepID=A0A3P5W7U5_9BACL|nr:hypothetical protein [Filibacter tadaridae]VDC19442.1 hypothetical protein FILTAD_00379 [Filibacter tadaridae]
MFKDLSPNIKSSITRSITQTFEQYMSNIGWSEEKFSIDAYMADWREYITTKALWYSKVPDDLKLDPKFHEDLAQRINEVIARILGDPPSEEQIVTIQLMQEALNTHYEYDCKAEAVYVETLLKEQMDSFFKN